MSEITKPVRTRFAPSPTGFLHVGAFRTALFSWLLARKYGGQFVLRIEDTDQNRLVPNSLEHIVRSLKALGLDYDEGPDRASVAALDADKYGSCDPSLLPESASPFGSCFQSQRLPRYREVIETLLESGKAYYAFETPEELEAKRAVAKALNRQFVYDRHFREYPLSEARKRVAAGEASVVRLKMPTEGPIVGHDALHGTKIWDAALQDDFIILKGDGFPPYHLAAMVDDHDMEITHVLRGDDWLSSYPKHVCLFEALGWEMPVFAHVPNVLGPDRKKLSKRHGALPILGPAPEYKDGKLTGEMLPGMLNQQGFLPEALVNYLALIGWSPGDDREVMTISELVDAFSLDGVGTSGGIFDFDKLTWMNGLYIRAMAPGEFAKRALPFLPEASDVEPAYLTGVVALEQDRVKRLDELPELTSFLLADLPEYNDKSVKTWLLSPGAGEYLTELGSALSALSDWNAPAIEAITREIAERFGREKGAITHPVRVALTGREIGPSLFDMMAVLGHERLAKRLAHAQELIRAATGS